MKMKSAWTNGARRDLIVRMHESAELTPVEISYALRYMSLGSGGLCLCRVRLVHRLTGEATSPGITSGLDQSGLLHGIYWLAATEEDEQAETLLSLPPYAAKLKKLLRKWNRTDGELQFELQVSSIAVPQAVRFYGRAPHKSPELISAVLASQKRIKLA
jgi:hypothetical protein